jgi:hypothetical protein
MAVLSPSCAAAPFREFNNRVIKNTHISFLDKGVYAFSSEPYNDCIKKYYWEHHRLKVAFRQCYKDNLVQLYKAEVVSPPNFPKNQSN